MYIVEDPLLALLVRFVGETANGDARDEEFLRDQVAAIRAHLEAFPAEEQEARAMEWIAEYSAQYRTHWQRATASERLADTRCPDCPLRGGDDTRPCEIHEHWLALLRRYASRELSAPDYVDRTLRLLAKHKERLRVTRH